MPSVVQMVAVHYANKSGRGQAALFVTAESAREMVEAGLAVWNKKATYINLTKTEASLHRAAQSITMGPKVTQGAAEGNRYHISLVEAWKGLRAA